MKNLIMTILMFSLIGCSSTKRVYSFDYPVIDGRSVPTIIDLERGQLQMVYFNGYPELQEQYEKYLLSKQINKNIKSSCFKDKRRYNSVNYINLTLSHVKLFRIFAAERNVNVKFKRYTQRLKKNFFKVQTQVVSGEINVISKHCYLNNQSIFSEVYY